VSDTSVTNTERGWALCRRGEFRNPYGHWCSVHEAILYGSAEQAEAADVYADGATAVYVTRTVTVGPPPDPNRCPKCAANLGDPMAICGGPILDCPVFMSRRDQNATPPS
jgi:hypothetical protein